MSLLEEKLRLAEMSVNEVIETLQDRGEGVQLKASEMLRQQQAEIDNLTSIKYVNGVAISNLYAEIEALKAENKKYEKHIAIGYLEELKK